MTTSADSFIHCLPSFEEEMIDVARAVIQFDPSRAHYMNVIEQLEQTAEVMRDYLAYLDAKKKAKVEEAKASKS